MKSKYLLASVSPLALALAFATPAMAQQSQSQLQKQMTFTGIVTYHNDIDVALKKVIQVQKFLQLDGQIGIGGYLEVDSWAGSTIDGKQYINDNTLRLTDVNQYNFANVLSLENGIYDTDGNIGVNIALGVNNAQANEVALTAIDTDSQRAGLEAEIFKYQEIYNNTYHNGQSGGISNNLSVTNDVISVANGNVGLNIAFGAFNAQENALSVAVADDDTYLAEATVGAIQEVAWNSTGGYFGTSTASLGGLVGGSNGNVGLNIALGVGNSQLNALAIAVVDKQ